METISRITSSVTITLTKQNLTEFSHKMTYSVELSWGIAVDENLGVL